MEALKKFTDNKERVEAEFIGFMEQSIWNCARNVTRKVSAEELRKSGISLEALYKGEYINYIEEENNKEIVYITISIIKSEEIFDKINYFREIIENKYFKYKVRVITNAN